MKLIAKPVALFLLADQSFWQVQMKIAKNHIL
jgi:hypothetical protein